MSEGKVPKIFASLHERAIDFTERRKPKLWGQAYQTCTQGYVAGFEDGSKVCADQLRAAREEGWNAKCNAELDDCFLDYESKRTLTTTKAEGEG